MANNSIIRNPSGWAEAAVGEKTRYMLLTVLSLCVGLFVTLSFDFGTLHWPARIFVRIVLITMTIRMPVCYLRVLRTLVLERKAQHLQEEKFV